MKKTKKLERLLAKYKKANRARLTAYARRSRLYRDCIWDSKTQTLISTIDNFDEVKAKINVDIEAARLYKLEVSAELRAYCKKKKYHLQWGNSNQITAVYTHIAWQLRKVPAKTPADVLLYVMRRLDLTKQTQYFY